MATFTINIQGLKEKKNKMNLLMQNVSRQGYHLIEVKNNVGFEDLNANELVQYKVFRRTLEKGLTKDDKDYFRYEDGENFAEAKLKGASDFIDDQKKKLNPSKANKLLTLLSNNPLISNLISVLIGALIGWLTTKG